MYRRFYPSEMKTLKKGSYTNMTKSQKMIYKIVKETPGLSQKEIAKKIDLTLSTVNYHINSMTKAGVVRLERDGNRTSCYVDKGVS